MISANGSTKHYGAIIPATQQLDQDCENVVTTVPETKDEKRQKKTTKKSTKSNPLLFSSIGALLIIASVALYYSSGNSTAANSGNTFMQKFNGASGNASNWGWGSSTTSREEVTIRSEAPKVEVVERVVEKPSITYIEAPTSYNAPAPAPQQSSTTIYNGAVISENGCNEHHMDHESWEGCASKYGQDCAKIWITLISISIPISIIACWTGECAGTCFAYRGCCYRDTCCKKNCNNY